jgi:hypothetical protein
MRARPFTARRRFSRIYERPASCRLTRRLVPGGTARICAKIKRLNIIRAMLSQKTKTPRALAGKRGCRFFRFSWHLYRARKLSQIGAVLIIHGAGRAVKPGVVCRMLPEIKIKRVFIPDGIRL